VHKPGVIYIHSGGNIIGGIETSLVSSFKYHKRVTPHIAIVKAGLLFDILKRNYNERVIKLGGGRQRNIYKSSLAIYRAIKYIKKNNIKLVIASGMHSWLYAGIISKLAHVKSILYLRNEINTNILKNTVDFLGTIIKPSCYIANSNYTAKTVGNEIKSEVKIIYPPVDNNVIESISESGARNFINNEFSIPLDHTIFLIAGRIQKWKGQHIAIKAFKKIRNISKSTLLIVGDTTFDKDREYYNRIKTIAKNHTNIKFVGFRSDIHRIIKGSDIILHTSITAEALGLIIIEGMMAGKPVIASALGGPLEIIEDGNTGYLIIPGSVSEYSKKMDYLIENKDIAKYVSTNAKISVINKYSIERSISKLEELILKLLIT